MNIDFMAHQHKRLFSAIKGKNKSSCYLLRVVNRVDDGNGIEELSQFLLGLSTLHATLDGSWVIDFHHRWYRPNMQAAHEAGCLL